MNIKLFLNDDNSFDYPNYIDWLLDNKYSYLFDDLASDCFDKENVPLQDYLILKLNDVLLETLWTEEDNIWKFIESNKEYQDKIGLDP